MTILNSFTDRVTHIKAALENNKTAYLVLKILFLGLTCSVLCFDLFPVINDYEPIILPAHMIAIIASIFITSFIWGSLLAAEAVWRLQLPVRVIRNIHSQKGWVLIDSLAAVLFVSIAFVALMLAYTMATKGTATAANRIQATYLAQQVLETLKTYDDTASIPSTIPIKVGTVSYSVTISSQSTTTPVPTTISIGVIPYTVTAQYQSVAAIAQDTNTPSLSAKLFPIQTVVSWTDPTGGPANQTVSMAGYYYVK
jgi:type II secretory pathway pseudopilin PulG